MLSNGIPGKLGNPPPDENGTMSHRIIPHALALLLASAQLFAPSAASAVEQSEPDAQQIRFFETHIRPLLHANCVKCHGENVQEGSLRLDSREGLLAGGDSGPAIVPGKANESLLLEAVRYESFEMPPLKQLKPEQIELLEKWVAGGAAWPVQNGKSVRLAGHAFTEEEKNFWSLQPIQKPDVPPAPTWAQNEIDAFVGQRLQQADLMPAARADETVLLRRLYYNVLGVPPDPTEVARSSQLADSNSWPRLVDRLLADSRFGEHWARHWLDLVRYAESDGFRADFYRPDAWRYRDYVINAFNDDKPYDQFVHEQLAGDEIAPDRADAVVATGYLRTYLYEYNQRDARTQWQDILNQVTDNTGEVFLGLGVGCARCHDHKFDPILQADYFRLQACFGTLVPRDDVPAVDLDERLRHQQAVAEWQAKAAEQRAELKRIRQPYMDKAAKGAIERFPEDIQVIMAKPAAERTPLEGQLADLVDRQILYDQGRAKIKDEDQKRIEELEQQIREIAGPPPAELPSALSVTELSTQPQPIHIGANPERKVVPAGGLTILNGKPFSIEATEASTGQRTALAKWITSRENPLAARVIVNRIWQQYFGTGLVETASDFGTLGGRPSHPELLDWLAVELMNHNWSLKWLHRTILTSATWQMSSFHPEAAKAESVDPATRLRWRFDIRRLTAEQIRDAMLTVSGELKSEQGGPSEEYDSLRRSLYLKALRNTPEPLLRSLDGVDGLNSISKRSTTTTPTQALNLMNGEWVRHRAASTASRLLDEYSTAEPADLVDAAFRLTLCRSASASESMAALQLLQQAGIDSRRTRTSPSLAEDGRPAIPIDDHHGPLAAEDSEFRLTPPFTVLAVAQLNSLYADATVRTLVSQWDSNNQHGGWSLGVTSTRSKYQPRNFILQVVSDRGYEVVASNLRPELNVPYLFGVSIEQVSGESAAGGGKATFFLKDLTGSSPLQTAVVDFKSVQKIDGNVPLLVGGRAGQKRHRWDGLVDQVALYSGSVNQEAVAAVEPSDLTTPFADAPLAYWNFADPEQPLAAVVGPGLSRATSASADPLQQAVAELCHVLLNSNEFVYLD